MLCIFAAANRLVQGDGEDTRKLTALSRPFMFKPFNFLQRFATLTGLFLTVVQAQNGVPDFEILARAAAAARDANHVDEALRDYREALKVQADWQEGLWYVGTLEYERDHYGEAIAAFRRLTELVPQAGPAWNFLGLCEYEIKDYDQAEQHLAKGQELGGTDDPEILRVAKYHLALLLIRGGKFGEAAAHLNSAIAQGASGTQLKTALGLATLRVPLLPQQVDPSREALLQETGNAVALVAQGQASAALKIFESLLRGNPDTPYLHLSYGTALLAAEKNRQAVEECRKEIEVSPRSASAHELLGQSLEAAGEHESARAELTEALELRSQESEVEQRVVRRYATASDTTIDRAEGDALWNAAMRSYSAGDYAEALAALKRWVKGTPNSGTAWAVMGLSEFALKDYGNARIHLLRGQQLGLSGDFESVQLARYRLGILLNRNGQFENGEGVLFSVAGKGPLAREVRFALGMSLLRMAMLPEEVAANTRNLVMSMGEVAEFLKDSRYDAAFPKLEMLSQQYPIAAYLHYVYGTALATFSRYDEAEQQFQKEITVSPTSELPYLQLASLALKRHHAEAALPLAKQAVKLAPASAPTHYLLGRAYLETGADKSAISELEGAKEIAPEDAQIHFSLGKAYAKANLAEKAAQERATFTRLNALAEERRSLQGSQSYGEHNSAESSIAPPNESVTVAPDEKH